MSTFVEQADRFLRACHKEGLSGFIENETLRFADQADVRGDEIRVLFTESLRELGEDAIDEACARTRKKLVDRGSLVSGNIADPFGFSELFAQRGIALYRYPSAGNIDLAVDEEGISIQLAPGDLGKITSAGFWVPTYCDSDFEILIDYELPVWHPGSGPACFALHAVNHATSRSYYAQLTSEPGEPHRIGTVMHHEPLRSAVDVKELRGSFRIRRRGNSVSTWHRPRQGEWLQLGVAEDDTGDPMVCGAKIWAHADSGGLRARIRRLEIVGDPASMGEEPPPYVAHPRNRVHRRIGELARGAADDGVARTRDLMARAGRSLAYGGLYSIIERYCPGKFPHFAVRGRGCRIEDSTGNTFIDWFLGWGPAMLGHCHPEVDAAVEEQLAKGVTASLMHPLEVEVAERIIEMVPCAERVAFGKNGSDVTTFAVRLARAVTDRELILSCGYHGFHDWYRALDPASEGVPSPLRQLILHFPYNDLDAARDLLDQHRDRCAAIILEPTHDVLPAPGFLEGLRELADHHGCLLIFDEVVTGFRLARGGAQECFGVTPDLATLGKALANGLPLSALAGREEHMRHLPRIGYGMTFRGETLSLAAAKASLEIIRREPVCETLARIGEDVRRSFQQSCEKHGLGWKLSGHPSRMNFHMQGGDRVSPEGARMVFLQECLKGGIVTNGAMLACSAHDDDSIATTKAALDRAVQTVAHVAEHGDIERVLDFPPAPHFFASPPKSVPAPQPPLGGFDSMVEVGGTLRISGWILWLDGPADEVVFHNRSGERMSADPVVRPDLRKAFPHIPHAEKGGIVADVPMDHMDRDGPVFAGTITGMRGGTELGSVPLYYHTPSDEIPPPRDELMDRVALTTSLPLYTAAGIHGINQILASVAPHLPLERIRRFLDFGCGCGRLTIRAQERLSTSEVFGADVDVDCISWLDAHVPSGHFYVCDPEPPLECPDGYFDLVFATSTFTHMTLASQRVWLPELARILAPGGILAISTHGPAMARSWNQLEVLAALEREGVFDGVADEFAAENDPRQYLRAAFQTEEYTRRMWSPHVEVVKYIPAGLHWFQDLWILRRPG